MSPSEPIDRFREMLQAGDHVSATTTRNGKIIGFGESQGRGRAASGDADDSGRVAITLVGSAPRGEEGTIQACRRLVTHLNSSGESWEEPTEITGVQYVDATAEGTASSIGNTLQIQVVRALTDPKFWESIGYSGSATLNFSLSDCADVLKRAVELKAEKIPPEIRTNIVLALDANDIPGLALDPVVEQFALRHSQWAHAQGFRSIWLVGPRQEMVSRLGLSVA